MSAIEDKDHVIVDLLVVKNTGINMTQIYSLVFATMSNFQLCYRLLYDLNEYFSLDCSL